MVILLLGQFPDAVGELEGLAEVLEFEPPFEVMLIDDPPAGIQLPRQAGQVFAGQRRDAAFAGHTLFLRQIRHTI